jgi:ATP adenylyltransferase
MQFTPNNRGLFSGASQPHKHIQMVPLQDEETGKDQFVLTQSLERQATHGQDQADEYSGIKHGFCSLIQLFEHVPDPQERSRLLYEKYISLLKSLGIFEGKSESNEDDGIIMVVCEKDYTEYERKKQEKEQVETHSMSFSLDKHPSYNLLLTSKFMLIVPRRLENYGGISANSLGFMFGLFVKQAEDRRKLVEEIGCMNFIRHITYGVTDSKGIQ